jgi:class 3 adenylate cyclase
LASVVTFRPRTDPELWRSIMDRFFAILCDGVHRFEGTVDKFTGDGIMAVFGAPLAHEDHAQRACWAALTLQRQLAAYATEVRRSDGLSFSVRMGINSGEVVVGQIGEDLRVEYTAVGHTVGLAQRMESLAEPGKAYLTEHTAKLVSGYLDFDDLGAEGPKNIALCAELCDGWLAMLFSPAVYDELYRPSLEEGFARPGARRSAEDFEVAATVPLIVTDDLEATADAPSSNDQREYACVSGAQGRMHLKPRRHRRAGSRAACGELARLSPHR